MGAKMGAADAQNAATIGGTSGNLFAAGATCARNVRNEIWENLEVMYEEDKEVFLNEN